jgi:DNA-binding NarL/FixJ family response regulator
MALDKWVSLGFTQGQQPTPGREPLVAETREPIRVLIADDDHRVRAALSTLLTSTAGFDVVGASATPGGALTIARQHRPTIALVDILFPEAPDGLGLLQALTAELHIPAIAMSIDGGHRKRALAAGATLFVDKDSTADSLIAALRSSAS